MLKRADSEKLPLSNEKVAGRMEQAADLLDEQNANPFRIRAYRSAAHLLRGMQEPVHEILHREGIDGLKGLPGIGHSLACSIEKLTFTGRLGLIERLSGQGEPEHLLKTVAGIGTGLASEIHNQLGIDSLQDLEIAACDGRLAQVPGMGPKRLRAVRDSLAGRFRLSPRISESRSRETMRLGEPDVSELLNVDKEYRQKAAQRRLPLIAPKRFNPTGEPWLPVLHTHRDTRHYTALYSNTARAHELGTVRDWVIIYRDDHGGDGQWTVVTGRFGGNAGRRIVRSRERECSQYYSKVARTEEGGEPIRK